MAQMHVTMSIPNFKSLATFVVCAASLCAFLYLNRQAYASVPTGDPAEASMRADSAAHDDEDNTSYLPDADLLHQVIEKGKQTFPVLIHLF